MRSIPFMRLRPLMAAAMVLAACGGGDIDAQGSAPAAGPPTVFQGAAVTTSISGVEVSDDLDAKPSITLPGGEPPAELEVVDVVEGDGEQAVPGATVTTHYVGQSWSSGRQFDSSWDRGEPIAFPLDRVIAGWTQGIPGMKVGGRRSLVIPAELAYGQSPPPGSGIAPGETLVFVIDLVATQ